MAWSNILMPGSKSKTPFYQAAMDAKQYGWNVKKGKVHGKERELQRAVVFEQYAEALNEVECWIGKLAFLIVIGQIQWMEG